MRFYRAHRRCVRAGLWFRRSIPGRRCAHRRARRGTRGEGPGARVLAENVPGHEVGAECQYPVLHGLHRVATGTPGGGDSPRQTGAQGCYCGSRVCPGLSVSVIHIPTCLRAAAAARPKYSSTLTETQNRAVIISFFNFRVFNQRPRFGRARIRCARLADQGALSQPHPDIPS